MQIVPLQPVPNQTVTITLDSQLCQINAYQKGANLYLDLLVDNTLIAGGVICENLNRLVRYAYLGFAGDLAFIDNQGSNDPVYTGLGPDTSARYNLAYISAAELA
jgi:hypothetical protein